jgi:hypothetical protein
VNIEMVDDRDTNPKGRHMFERLTTQAIAMEHRRALDLANELVTRVPRPVRNSRRREHFLRLPEKSEITPAARRAAAEHVTGD